MINPGKHYETAIRPWIDLLLRAVVCGGHLANKLLI